MAVKHKSKRFPKHNTKQASKRTKNRKAQNRDKLTFQQQMVLTAMAMEAGIVPIQFEDAPASQLSQLYDELTQTSLKHEESVLIATIGDEELPLILDPKLAKT